MAKFAESKLEAIMEEEAARYAVLRKSEEDRQEAMRKVKWAEGQAVGLRNHGRHGEAERMDAEVERYRAALEKVTEAHEQKQAAWQRQKRISTRLQQYAREKLGWRGPKEGVLEVQAERDHVAGFFGGFGGEQ